MTILVEVDRYYTGRDLLGGMLLRVALGCAAVVGGCGAPQSHGTVRDDDPGLKIPAIKASVASRDLSVVAQLVKDLESDDPAVRFYAINGLQRLTGQSFGYQYYAGEDQRQPAIQKWKAWLEGWEAGQSLATGKK